MNGEDEIVEMPAEVDFSDSIPNPYIAKVRRETMKAIVDKDAKDRMPDGQEAAAVSDGGVGVRRK